MRPNFARGLHVYLLGHTALFSFSAVSSIPMYYKYDAIVLNVYTGTIRKRKVLLLEQSFLPCGLLIIIGGIAIK